MTVIQHSPPREQEKPASLTNGAAHQAEPMTIPPLSSGDRLSRAEFERRYTAHPEIKKAELIAGVVYVASPIRIRQHSQPHGHIILWLGTYCAATPGLYFSDNGTVRMDAENEPQPDVALWLDEAVGGQARIDEDDYLAGAPELIIEVAASSAAYDLHDKQQVYQRNRVQEYLILLTYEQRVIWFSWQQGEYVELTADPQGILRSQSFPGLWLHAEHFWAGDLAGLLAILQQGLQSPGHTAFVEQLRFALRSSPK